MLDKPQNVYNVDETGLSGSQSARILCKKGIKYPARICGNNKKIIFTVTFCCNAAGTCHHTLVKNRSQCGICGLKMAQKNVNKHARRLGG